MAVAQRLNRRFDDEFRLAEFRLADPKVEAVAALRYQRIGAGKHRERFFFTDAAKAGIGLDRLIRLYTRPCCHIFLGRSSPDRLGKINESPVGRSLPP